MNSNDEWNQIKHELPMNTVISGIVTRHVPFGVFVELPGIPFDGLVQITDFKDGDGIMTIEEYPKVGSNITAVVLGHKDQSHQIWLGMRPSQLGGIAPVERKSLEPGPARTLG